MSFGPPSTKTAYKTTYTKGDLFYGFGEPRLALMKFLKVPTSETGLSALFMINNYMGTGDEIAELAKKEQVATEAYMQKKKEEFTKEQWVGHEDIKSLKWNDPAKQQFLARVEEAFDIKKAELEEVFKAALLQPHQDFWKTLETHNNGKYASALKFKRKDAAKGTADSAENSAWRKKCKGGIYYGTHVLKQTVHFCLSLEIKANDKVTGFKDMDFSAVVKKTSPTDTAPDTTTGKIRLITPAELRWIYRHREDESVKENIQFWTHVSSDAATEWKACGPPWEKDQGAKELWASYKPKSTNVHSGVD
jgi:hypothetical protein